LVHRYAGSSTFFREHHDAGNWAGREGSPELVRLSRLEGGARVCTVFVYLTSHGEDDGGGTTFPLLEPALTVQPKQRSAAVWCNCTRSGELDVRVVHSAEPLKLGRGQSQPERDHEQSGHISDREEDLAQALQDRNIPLKIGMNIWFTDLPNHPHK
jgi:hypothetical protein